LDILQSSSKERIDKEMKAFLKKLMMTFGAFSLMFAPSLALVAPVHAQTTEQGVCKGIEATGSDSCREDGDAENSFGGLARRVINIFSIVVGAVSVIMIIIGGFRYIISGGDSNGVQGAKNTILYAIVGLVIVLFAQVIVRFVLSNVSTE
jgi:hypothetical protein